MDKHQEYLKKEISKARKQQNDAQENGMTLSAQYYQGMRFALLDALNHYETTHNLPRTEYDTAYTL